jgi:hypothetical protein
MERFDKQPPIRKATFVNAGEKPVTVRMFNGPGLPVDETEVRPGEKVKMPALLRASMERQGLTLVGAEQEKPRELPPDPRDEKISKLEEQVELLMSALKQSGALGAVQDAKNGAKGGKATKDAEQESKISK